MAKVVNEYAHVRERTRAEKREREIRQTVVILPDIVTDCCDATVHDLFCFCLNYCKFVKQMNVI